MNTGFYSLTVEIAVEKDGEKKNVRIVASSSDEAAYLRRVGAEGLKVCPRCDGDLVHTCPCCYNETDCTLCFDGYVSIYKEQQAIDLLRKERWVSGGGIPS